MSTPHTLDLGASSASLAAMAECTRVLGALFYRPPDHPDVAGFLALVRDGRLADAWPVGEPEPLRAIATQMQTGLAADDAPAALRAAYQRLFWGPDHLEAPPWGSVHLEDEGMLYGESTQALQAFLVREGIALAIGQEEPEDHFGLLLWAATLLAEEERLPALRTLVEVHLCSWSDLYLARLEAAAGHPFYAGLAGLARLTLEALLALMTESPRFP